MNRPRIVSLLPSCTEIACALGLGDQLVGRSHECDFPPEVRRLPVCTAPRVDTKAGSGATDRQVRSLLRQALSVFHVDADALKELGPDLVLTQSLCDVCAVTPADLEGALRAWTGAKPRILSLAPASLADVWNDILRVAEACGVADRGRALAGQLVSRVEITAARVRALPRSSTVACIEWLDPLMAAGNWVPELVDLAGGQNLFGEPGRHSPWLDWETLRQSDPDIIVVMPCGFDLARTRGEMPALTRRAGWEKLAAARNRRVCLTDGNQYFNRPGPRLVESLEVLAEIIHPGTFRFEGRDRRWAAY